MGISFQPEGRHTATYACRCMVLYIEENHFLEGHDDCLGYLPVPFEGNEIVPEFSCSSDNAEELFKLLNLDSEEIRKIGYGTLEAADLLCRINVARSASHQEFARSSSRTEHGSSVVMECGLPASRFEIYLNNLAEVTNWALERELPVSWA